MTRRDAKKSMRPNTISSLARNLVFHSLHPKAVIPNKVRNLVFKCLCVLSVFVGNILTDIDFCFAKNIIGTRMTRIKRIKTDFFSIGFISDFLSFDYAEYGFYG